MSIQVNNGLLDTYDAVADYNVELLSMIQSQMLGVSKLSIDVLSPPMNEVKDWYPIRR